MQILNAKYKEYSMQISWIQAFVEAADRQNFTEAAEIMYVSQSTLSKYIKSLEAELDVILFDRTTRSTKLTYEGEQVLQYARDICDSYQIFIKQAAEYKASRKNTIRLVSTPLMHLYDLAEIIVRFQQQFPDIHLIMHESELKPVLKCIETGQADVAIIRQTSLKPYDDYQVFPLIDDELVILCNKNHPIASKQEVGIHEAVKEKLYALQGSVDLLKNALERYDIDFGTITITACVNGFAVANFLKYNDGISLIVRSTAKRIGAMDDLCIVSLKEHPPYPVQALMGKKDTNFTTMKFINYLLTNFSLS